MNVGADLYVDGFPHGTPEGYADGCRGGSCPAGTQYGLTCKTANTKSHGDYQYKQLRTITPALTVAEIATKLGLHIPKTPPAPPTPPEEPTMTINLPKIPALAEGGIVTLTPTPAAEIRAWAHSNGIDCPAKGPVPRRVLDAYDLNLIGEALAPRPEWATVTRDADVEAATTALEAAHTDLEAARTHAINLAAEMLRQEDLLEQHIERANKHETRNHQLQRDNDALHAANLALQHARHDHSQTPTPTGIEQALMFALTKWAETNSQLLETRAAPAATINTPTITLEAQRSPWWARR